MPLPVGARIGAYEVTGALGAGGMGEVYRARDARLGRDVALKVLAEAFAADPDRLQRFEREARTLAALNHPNIAAIYGIEGAGASHALVMELVDGDDLAASTSRAMSIADALAVAKQIADALDAAHQQGIVHRDLKPANIKIRPDGSVKVLDFGLAKALSSDANASGTTSAAALPTMTSPAMTAMGVILGTAAYMSPEQARGRGVDRRADLWAFGVVLFEMLTGRQLFAGDSITDVLAAVVKEDPDWSTLPPDTPAPIRRLLRRCLEKDPQRRLRDAADARLEIEDAIAGRVDGAGPASNRGATPTRRSSSARGMLWAASVVAALFVGAGIMRWSAPPPPDLPVRRFSLQTPDHERATEAVISPDGRLIAFASANKAWLQALDRSEPREIPNSTGARSFFWSPDSAQIGFQTNGFLWRADTTGGNPTRIAAVPADFSGAGGAAWLPNGRVWFTTGNTGLLEVSVDGGAARSILEVDKVSEVDLHHAAVLPDGRGVLFVPHRIDGRVNSIDVFDGRERRIVLESAAPLRQPSYSPSGHLLFARDQGVWGVAFSLAEMKTSGDPFLISADASSPSAAADGTLVAIPEGSSADQQLAWAEPGNRVTGTIGRSGIAIRSPRLSPDGRSIVATILGGNVDLHVFDVERGSDRRLTFETDADRAAVWSSDGQYVVYECGAAICSRRADGTGERVTLVPAPAGSPTLSPDRRWLLFAREQAQSNIDIFIVPLGPKGLGAPPVEPPRPLVVAERLQGVGMDVSPDGQWLAYESNESGQGEIFVTTFPKGEGKWQVSRNGGGRPLWSPAGDRVYYRNAERIVEVPVAFTPTPSPGAPRDLVAGPAIGVRLSAHGMDRSPDGSRFVVVRSASGLADTGSVSVVEQWFKEHGSRK